MTITIEATYENGVLKPLQPLTLGEHQRVQITIQTLTVTNHGLKPPVKEPQRPTAPNAYGIIGWTGDSETIQRIALDPEFGIHESP
jgi:predicted DNA-binding antitoxin AbrB/MazE fold protein